MQDGIGASGNPFDANLSSGWMEEREQFSGSVLGILMRLLGWFPFRLPMIPRIGDRLVGSSFVLRPDR